MDWDDLKIFLAVARRGQILGAARRLGLNHATVGRRLEQFEIAIGAKLFHRRPAGCSLTVEGSALLPTAERVEAEMAAAHSLVGGAADDYSGIVRVGAPDGLGTAFLAPRLVPLLQAHHRLTVQLVPAPRSFSISRREADIAITLTRPQRGRVVARKLVDYELCLYASEEYLARKGRPDTMQDLVDHDLVGHVEDLAYSPALNYILEVFERNSSRFEIASSLGQLEAVAAGAGVGILHAYIGKRRAELVRILPHVAVQRSYWLVYHENAQSIPSVRCVANFIASALDTEREYFAA